jgi:phage terminase large subunit
MNPQKHLKFKLIDGCFSAEEARDILLALINHKIAHHEMQAFSQQVRFSSTPDQERLKSLNEAKQLVKAFFEETSSEEPISMFSEIELVKTKAAIKQ